MYRIIRLSLSYISIREEFSSRIMRVDAFLLWETGNIYPNLHGLESPLFPHSATHGFELMTLSSSNVHTAEDFTMEYFLYHYLISGLLKSM